jgi:TRAP-type C4-dicarboxylate transport system substrate-binding protein
MLRNLPQAVLRRPEHTAKADRRARFAGAHELLIIPLCQPEPGDSFLWTVDNEQQTGRRFAMKFKGILSAGLAICAFVLPTIGRAQDDIKNMNLRWAHFAPPAWGSAQAEQLFAKEIEKRTNGKVKIQFFWSGALGGPSELMELVASGAVDIASVVPTYHPAQWPMMGLINSLPMTWQDPKLAMDIQEYLIANNKAIQDELAKNKLKVILIHGLPPYRLQCTTPVKTLADLKGKRIRTFGDWPPYVMKQIGAVPVNVPLGEIYESIQRGSLDCGYNPVENSGFLKLYEVAKNWSDINFGAIAAYSSFMNVAKYEALPESLKKIFKEAYDVAVAWEKQNFEVAEKKHLADAEKAGAKVIAFEEQDKLDAAFPNMLQVWEEAMCAKNLCEQAKSVVADTRKVMEKSKR